MRFEATCAFSLFLSKFLVDWAKSEAKSVTILEIENEATNKDALKVS